MGEMAGETILVTGGLGGLGSDVTRALVARGAAPRALTHRAAAAPPPGATLVVGDLRDGAGLAEAVDGVSTIIHCASSARDADFATERAGARILSLLAAASRAHLIYISIIGVDRSDYGYYAAKREAETIIEQSGASFTILRASQFHSLVYGLLRSWDTGAGGLRVPPDMRFQSVDRVEVAARLVALADGPAAGYAAPMRGPETLEMAAMASAYLTALGRADEPVEALDPASAPPSVFRTGVNLLPEDAPATTGCETWATYLRDRSQG